MIKNMFSIIVRNFIRQKAFSFINIFGLSIGMAVSIIILLYVKDELSYDKYNENADRTYRVTREWLNDDGSSSLHLARVAPPIATLLKKDFPDAIQEVNRLFGGYGFLIKSGSGSDEVSYEERYAYLTDDNFFDVFSIKLLQGNKATVLSGPGKVVITESAARRYFGDENPIGKTLRTINYQDNSDIPLLVTGVMEETPSNSHFRIDLLASLETMVPVFGRDFFATNWGSNNFATYILFADQYKAEDLQKQFPDFLDRHLGKLYDGDEAPKDIKPSDYNILHLQKLTDIHLKSKLSTELSENGDITNVRLFSAIAIFILIIACINFMNLATARSARRAREVGVRKVMGAFRGQLVLQFLIESIVMVFVSLIFALLIVELSLPYFNDFAAKDLKIGLLSDPAAIIGLVGLTIVTGFIAGSYPAFYLSSFKPIKVLKSSVIKSSGGLNLRKVLVIFQFAIAISLIISMIIIHNQRSFMLNKELGYDHDQIIVLRSDRSVMERLETIKGELLTNPAIQSVSGSSLIPSDRLLNSQGGKKLDGNTPEPIGFMLANVDVDYDYLKTFGIELLAGRDFSREFSSDDTAAFILNQTAVKRMGWGDANSAINRRIEYGNETGRVIGVVKDFYFESLHNEITPIIFRIEPGEYWNISVKVSGQNLDETISFLEDKWKYYRSGQNFEYSFLDDNINRLYHTEKRLGNIFNIFSALAIFIGLLGLFGMASFSAEQRTREIGVRKVFGAEVSQILWLLTQEFTKWVLLANLIAWPLTWFVADIWLDDFANRISFPYLAFIIAGISSFALSAATVAWQAVRAARQNPVNSLKYE